VNLADNRLTDEFVIWLQRFLKNHRQELGRHNLTQIDLHGNALSVDMRWFKVFLHQNELISLQFNLPEQKRQVKVLRKKYKEL
jgi:hypothetical protein